MSLLGPCFAGDEGLLARILGVRAVADRVAQTVVAARLEQGVEPMFHADS